MDMVPGAPVPTGSRAFGALRAKGKRHEGTDLFADKGDPVHAPIDGSVRLASRVWVGGFSRYGRFIVLDLRDGRELLVAHLEDVEVSPGDEVRKGDLLGTVGDTLFTRKDHDARFETSDPHVHVELLRGQFPDFVKARLDPTDLAFGVGDEAKKKRVFLVTVEEQ